MQRAPKSVLTAHDYVLTFLMCSLSVTVLLKVGEIQYLELFLALDIPVLLWIFTKNDLRVRVFRPFFSIGRSYGIFLVIAFLLALLGLRQEFTAANETMLKRPVLVTISRMAELILDVVFMLYVASRCREDEELCRFGGKTYFWIAVTGCLYSVVSIPISYLAGLDLGFYGTRMRGFDNEGGPYGTYLVSVFAVTHAMYRKGWISRRAYYPAMALFVTCFFGSQSKAGFFVFALMLVLYLIWSWRGWKRISVVTAVVLLLVGAGIVLDIPAKIAIYRNGSATYEAISNLKWNDANVVMGRVAGAVLAPRMIAAHPLAGIGWGNYPLVRDDPEYRQGTAFSTGTMDAPGLGLIDYIAELGFPLCVYLTWILIKPAYLLRKRGADAPVIAMAALQPVCVSLGTHLNLIYPWAVVALALGMGFNNWKVGSPAVLISSPS